MTFESRTRWRDFSRTLRRTAPIIALIALPLLCGVAESSAQEGASGEAAPVSTGDGGSMSLLLDAPISRTDYTIGPGDVLALSIFGDVSRLDTLAVGPDGTVVIPSVGIASVLDLNLDQAQARIRDLVFRQFRNVDVHVTLARARRFKVFVVGDVPEPGLRLASPATRVSEVVPAVVDGVVRRNVFIRRPSGDTVDVDLVRFRQTGDLTANPTLREGDAVLVRAIDQTIQVFGRVYFPGRYEYRQDESLAQFLSIVNGSRDFPSDAADTIRVTRFVGAEKRELYVFSREESLGPRGQSFVLEPFDAVFLAAVANFKQQKTATVRGQVVHPGTYPIEPGATTVRDLVAIAGGFTPEASLVNATLRRQPDAGSNEGLQALQEVPPEYLTRDERRILQVRSRGDETNVVINFDELFAAGRDAYDQTVKTGDLLTVPRASDEVAVLGAVLNPGLVAYAPGQSVEDLVERAGGYADRADRNDIVVLKAKLGTQTSPGDAMSIDPGDKIIVPFKERRTFLERIAAANNIVGTVSGFVLTVLTITRLLDNG